MGAITLSLKYAKNTGQSLSAAELKSLFFTGIRLADQDGNPISTDSLNFYIQAADVEVANQLMVKLFRVAYREDRDFMFDDFVQFGYLPTSFMVSKPLALEGLVNTTLQLTMPPEWLAYKKQANAEDCYYRQLHLVAISGAVASYSGSYLIGWAQSLGLFSLRQIPNYWRVSYLTGFQRVPLDILRYIGSIVTVRVLEFLNDIVTGIPGNVTSKSIGIDGLSQSVSVGGYFKRIESMRKENERTGDLLRTRYRGYILGVLG